MPEADFSAEAEAEEDFGSIEIPSESPGLPQMDSELPQEEPEISEEDLGSADDELGDDIIHRREYRSGAAGRVFG